MGKKQSNPWLLLLIAIFILVLGTSIGRTVEYCIKHPFYCIIIILGIIVFGALAVHLIRKLLKKKKFG